MKILVAGCFFATLVSASVALSETLPNSAKRLSSQEVKKTYSGKSVNWKKTRGYFSSNGKYLGIGKDKSWYSEGRWRVSGNKVYVKAKWKKIKTGKTGNASYCWTWYKDGRRFLSIWSGNKKIKDAYWDGERKKLSRGDRVTRIYQKLKKKAGG